MSLKDSWKKVGRDFAALGTDLGKSIVLSVKEGADAAAEWAVEDDKKKQGCNCNCDCNCKDECTDDCKDGCKDDNACDCGCNCKDDAPQS